MPIAKRRKVSAVKTRNASSPAGITAFTKVSKAQALGKSIIDKSDLLSKPIATQLVQDRVIEGRKRTAEVAEIEVDEEADEDASAILASVINNSERDIKPLPKRRSIALQKPYETPERPLHPDSLPASLNTPSKGAATLLAKFAISSSSPTELVSSSPVYSSQATNITLPSSQESENDLPTELQELLNLHSSFLTALSLHYAHNGTHTPADLWLLCPDVARAWGKRRVVLEDIRRVLAILNRTSQEGCDQAIQTSSCAHLSLSDYGFGKICIEIKTSGGRPGNIARPLDENCMNDTFTNNLRNIWTEQQSESGIQSSTDLITHLPLEPIKICSSLAKMSPLLAKGQRRLEDLRAGVLAQKTAAAAAAKQPQCTMVNSDGRKLTLLERLQAKQRQAANAPPPPTKADLSRKAGLHRLDEVVAVLTLLTTSTSVGQSRVSFTLPTILGKLKDSFKTPMSREEGDVCIRLLAQEIAPEWLKIVQMKKVEQVVVNREARPSDVEISDRVKKAITA